MPSDSQHLTELGELTIGPTMGSSFYCYFQKEVSEQQISALKQKMAMWVEADLSIELHYVSYTTAVQLYGNTAEWREYLRLSNSNRVPAYCLDGEPGWSSPQVLPCVHRCGLLEAFDLKKEGEGFLLRFPDHSQPFSLSADAHHAPQLLAVYRKYREWNRNVGVNNVSALVRRTEEKKGIEKLITLAETHQQKTLAQIADMVQQRNSVRLLLIAGPSSSGKTTFTKKLALQLEILGYQVLSVSLDDFYMPKHLAPKDENGQPDLECLEALQVERLQDNLGRLLGGEQVEFPIFDFVNGQTAQEGRMLELKENSIVLLEGIHGLNPRLTPKIPREQKFCVYIAALTQLNILPSLRMPTSDNRLLRRIVRDYQFRNHSAHQTLAMWGSVQRGEQLHIFPHQEKADAVFNSVLEYEIPILKTYAAPLLKQIKPDWQTYAAARRLEQILSFFPSLSSSAVPRDSILREFIGGSSFHY